VTLICRRHINPKPSPLPPEPKPVALVRLEMRERRSGSRARRFKENRGFKAVGGRPVHLFNGVASILNLTSSYLDKMVEFVSATGG
jgi:hypothetical protein